MPTSVFFATTPNKGNLNADIGAPQDEGSLSKYDGVFDEYIAKQCCLTKNINWPVQSGQDG
jgi:hypothetical protein